MKFLICGTRKKGYDNIVRMVLNGLAEDYPEGFEIIEGCCPDSADQYSEDWAKENNVKVRHNPGTKGTYLKRNIEMAHECDRCIAFWDGYSYGTAHTIAHCVALGKKVRVVMLK